MCPFWLNISALKDSMHRPTLFPTVIKCFFLNMLDFLNVVVNFRLCLIMIVFWEMGISVKAFFAGIDLFIILCRAYLDWRVITKVVRRVMLYSLKWLGIEFRNIEICPVYHWTFYLRFLTESLSVHVWVKFESGRHVVSAHTAVVGHWGVNCVGCLNWIRREKSRFIRFERATCLAILILQIINGITIMLITEGLEFVLNHSDII